MSSTHSESREKIPRAKNAKVKSGCVTCKIRRVKCDETKPECLRCLKFGVGYCDGYQAPKRKYDERRALVLRNSTAVQKLAPKRDPVVQVFKNQEEFSCFRLYCEEVAFQLSSSSHSIWHRLLLQAGQNQPFIRHAVIAIGALHRFLKTTATTPVAIGKRPSLTLEGAEANSSTTYALALQSYDKFLLGVKGDMARVSSDEGRRMAMIACLLVVCIETMQYQYSSSLEHAIKGFRLLDELKANPGHVQTYNGLSSPVPNVVEDEVVQQFHQMEIQVMAVFDARRPIFSAELKHEGITSIRDMPEHFKTVEQARLYLVLVMRRTYHFMSHALSDQSIHLQFGGEGLQHPSIAPGEAGRGYPFRPKGKPEEMQVQQEMYAAENRRWASAFEPLLRVAMRSHEPESICAIVLKIHSLATTIRLAGHFASSELVYDHFLPEFEKLTSLTEVVLTHPHTNKYFASGAFSFDMGLIYPLMTTAQSCRDRTLRRRAISLLCTRPWREAQWHSETAADIGRFLMDVEEEGLETEYIPEDARARLSGIVADLEKGALHVNCIQGAGENATQRECVMYYHLG